jgi:TetR/AcrR family transcriptional regulator, transcriptional repressor for nem operon
MGSRVAPSEPPRRREVSKAETREALITAGIAVFAEQGLDAPSLDSICARAGFTRGAFYVHFKDRDDLLLAVMEKIFSSFLDAIIATGDAALDLRLTIEAFTAATVQGAFPLQGAVPFHRFLAACARSDRIRERFVAVLREAVQRVTVAVQEGQEAGTVRRDVDPEHVASLLTAIALGLQAVVEVKYPVDVDAAKGGLLKLLMDQDGDGKS